MKDLNIIKLKDVGIDDIRVDKECISLGCETCGYGSDFCSTLIVEFDDGTEFTYEKHQMYEFNETFTMSYIIRLFCFNVEAFANMTKEEFKEFLNKKLYKEL